ncbi:DNA polymerase III subunit beta [Clostridium perfringens]|uniref:DNA polymerase III subunit beta n=1 Tax=Clostridium perfringens TaxID=1502 RepID=UPI001CCBF354|nr:DNA polymerase III subunit beta [Clostridium perfringens]MCO6002129.1 DNA polymerase III subunit beta [Clostridium perfringens]MCO7394241.1 DNA polymerase III subunit beta [Clostridium perfringens]MCP8914829.1 DNA polymerase III subunit beta [Clostridium perfringens]MCP8964682.1 DNA polymerase III subunit beta [Clostridium perfringens]UBK39113.1 DNA polymerase III subunit beta [Clostridium perfringens]
MKIKIDSKELKEFKKVSKAKKIQIRDFEGKIELYACVDEIEILKTINGIIEESGAVAINSELIDIFPNGECVLSENGLNFENSLINLLEVPEVIKYDPFFYDDNFVKGIKKDKLKEILEIEYAMDKSEVRPVLRNICLKGNDAVALDGYRLAKRITNLELEEQILIPYEAVKILKRLKGDAAIDIADSKIIFRIGDYDIRFENADLEYIRYWTLIPKDNDIYCEVDSKTLLNSLKRLSKIHQCGNRLARIEFKKEVLTICVDRFDLRIRETIGCKCNSEITIGFNSEFLMEAVKRFQGTIKICLKNNISPALLVKDGKEDLVLPIRIMERQ